MPVGEFEGAAEGSAEGAAEGAAEGVGGTGPSSQTGPFALFFRVVLTTCVCVVYICVCSGAGRGEGWPWGRGWKGCGERAWYGGMAFCVPRPAPFFLCRLALPHPL